MKKLIVLAIVTTHLYATAQNVGVGTTTPALKLHVASTGDNLVLENLNDFGPNSMSTLFFAHNLNGGSNSKYAGAIRTIGTSATQARMGFFTNATTSRANLVERLSITNAGKVGINETNPSADLEVNGKVQCTNLEVSEDVKIAGDLIVKGLGIIRSTSGGQLKYTTYLAGFGAEIGAFASTVSTIGFGGFTKAPQVFVCGVSGSPSGEFFKIQVVPFAITKDQCSVRLYNASNSTSTFNANWIIVCIGE